MARRDKRTVKKRSKAHKKLVKSGRRRRIRQRRKVGYGQRIRRKKRLAKKK
jgi:hypothetical protein